MKQFDSVDEILDFAMEQEQASHDFYMDLAGRMSGKHMSATFRAFAREELGHKAKILEVKEKGFAIGDPDQVQNLKIADYVVEEEEGELDYQGALILAMKKEKKAFLLYNQLAEATSDAALRELFLFMAQEEAKHKLRFEVEYDENVLRDN